MNLAFYKNKSFIFELMEKQLIKLFVAASDVLSECIEGEVGGNVTFSLSYMTLDKEYNSEFKHSADYDANEAGQIYLHMLSVFNMSRNLLQDSIIRKFAVEWNLLSDQNDAMRNTILLNVDFTSEGYSVFLNNGKKAKIEQSFADELGKSELESFCDALTEQILQTEKPE